MRFSYGNEMMAAFAMIYKWRIMRKGIKLKRASQWD
jgi:hypothetical protein